MPVWTVNRAKPRLWCLVFHGRDWFSNDWGTWWTSGRRHFEVLCTKCGDCWTEEHTWLKR
jgi:hypothetical protein